MSLVGKVKSWCLIDIDLQDSILHMKCTILGSYIQYSAVAFFAWVLKEGHYVYVYAAATSKKMAASIPPWLECTLMPE